MPTLRSPCALAAALLAGAAGCGGSDSPTAPHVAGIQTVAGARVSDTVLSVPVQALVVEVRGPGGSLARGAAVRFEVRASFDTARRFEVPLYACPVTAPSCGPIGGPGFLRYAPAGPNSVLDTTDANGRARATVRLGTIAGPAYVVVTAPDLGMRDSVLFTVAPGAPAGVAFAARDVPLSIGGKTVLGAAIIDAYGNARGGTPAYTLGGPAGVATFDAASRTVRGQDVGTAFLYARAGSAVDSATVRVVPGGRLVVWDANAVRVIGTDGSGPRTLATGVGSDFGAFPRFSPNAAVVAFHTSNPGATEYNNAPTRLVVVDSGGTNRREIGLPPGVLAVTYPRVLAGGTVMFVGRKTYDYELSTAPTSVYAIATGGAPAEVAALPGATTFYGAFAISRDGARVAYVSTSGLRVLTFATGQNVVVDADGNSPEWSPAGDRIAYLSSFVSAGDGTGGRLTTVNADGTGRTTFAAGRLFSPGLAWSPDAAYLLGRDAREGGAGLIVWRLRDGANTVFKLPAVPPSSPVAFGDYFQPDWR